MSSEPAQPPRGPEAFGDILRERLTGFGLVLSELELAGMATYLSELDLWRRKFNLVGNLSGEELGDHALESLLASRLIVHGERVIDVGSGAGFPGLPLAIARRDLRVTLVEPRAKKCAFLRHIARLLELANVTVFEGRVEEVGGQTFEAVTTRAFGEIAVWMRDGGLLEPGGRLLAWTTNRQSLREGLDGRFEDAGGVPIPGSRSREIAIFRKR